MGQTGNPLRVVVFGGIGSGKSTLGAMLAARGAVHINADEVGHQILHSDGEAYHAVSSRWPDAVVAGEIDRGKLAEVVFADPAELAALEAITHPAIAARIAAAVAVAGDEPVVVELPLVHDFLGSGWVWVLIDAPADTRLERAVARGADRADVAARMRSQASDEQWHDMADWIVPNTGSIDDLQAAADELWTALTTAA